MTVNAPIYRASAVVVEAEYGPQHAIGATDPGGVEITAADYPTGADINTLVQASAEGTTFWIRAGMYTFSSASDHIVPKSNQSFIAEYGAIFDGSGWTYADPADDPDEGAFQALSLGSVRSTVTIRNLEIR